MSDANAEEPKLIIDEDWKSRVEREKEQVASTPPGSSQPAESATQAIEKTDADEPLPPPPPASFEFLVSSLATQAVAAMGKLPSEDGQNLPVNREYAKHFIDLLGVIEDKTQGNLNDAENSFLQDALRQIRMLFVSTKG